ncbi:hypothetical protein [Shouchella clausii]|uniref:hypothetical protein n=1 Tax=Shouchella clausii TaxID=79880 RepID=UPI000BA53AEB|nr:hypothetical protein [Shouchella clausii]PAD43830.1 hypothetical protein CHH54_05035 [Bacillus sp. 7520-S]PAD92023.1 hypothetical protein CHH52_11795 [Shouchella clausii]
MKWWFTIVSLVVTIGLFTWQLVEYFRGFGEIETAKGSWEMSINILPMTILIIGAIIYGIVSAYLKKKKGITFQKGLLVPPEFSERDEREKEITANACRTAYLSMYIIYPVLAALLVVYPLVQTKLPYLPIILVMAGPLLQASVYMVSWRKGYLS